MKKITSAMIVVLMFFMCSVVVFAKDENPKEDYVELAGNYSFLNGFTLSLFGEYHYNDIYRLRANVSSDFIKLIGISLYNDIRILSISGYNIGAKIDYNMSKFFDSTSYNKFSLGIHGNKLFADKVEVTLGIGAVYVLELNVTGESSTIHKFDGLNISIDVDYEVNNKLDLRLNVDVNVLSFTDRAEVNLGAKYKLTDKLLLNGNIGVLYSFEVDNSFGLYITASVDYEINDKFDLWLNVFNIFTSSAYYKNNRLSAGLEANYKLTDKLLLNGGIGIGYDFRPVNPFDLPVNSFDLLVLGCISYKFDLGLNVKLGIQTLLSNDSDDDTSLFLSVRYTF